ncbi:MAG: hypothetical protein WDM96_12960 [Lacunisphaera sp.]
MIFNRETDDREFLGRGGIVAGGIGREVGRVGMDPGAGLDPVYDHQADDERKGGEDFKINERLQAHPSDLAQVAHAADADDDRGEDDRTDQHLHRLDESFAERLQCHAGCRLEMAEQRTQHDSEQHLHIKVTEVFHRVSRDLEELLPRQRSGTRLCLASPQVTY